MPVCRAFKRGLILQGRTRGAADGHEVAVPRGGVAPRLEECLGVDDEVGFWRHPRIVEPHLPLANLAYDDEVARVSCFLLIHYNGTKLPQIPERIAALRKFNKPIVCNEDDKVGRQAAQALLLSVENGASYGLMLNELNQYQPFEFKGAADDRLFYNQLKELTSSRG